MPATDNPALNFSLHPFSGLSLQQLYEILALRAAVFVVEQECAYLDPDGRDPEAYHLLGYAGEKLGAYARLLPAPGEYAVIGRVVVHPDFRGNGYGRELMQLAVEKAAVLYHVSNLSISAQCYLRRFYESLGFIAEGEPYLEDDIPHIKMQLQWRQA